MASIAPVVGGAGASAMGDGTDGAGALSSFLKNTPLEITEIEVPIKFLRYGLVPDSGGAGRYRGGLATELEIQVFAPDTVVTARNRDRTIFAAWGGNGGKAGQSSSFWKQPDGGERINLGNTDVVPMGPGDVINLTSGGGGGWGDPLTRPIAEVARDVARRKLTGAAAEQEYGVVFTGNKPDPFATDVLRTTRRHAGAQHTTYAYNDGRVAFEQVWTDANYAALDLALKQIPVQWRHFVKRGVFDHVAAMPADQRKGDGSEVRAGLAKAMIRLPQLAASIKKKVTDHAN